MARKIVKPTKWSPTSTADRARLIEVEELPAAYQGAAIEFTVYLDGTAIGGIVKFHDRLNLAAQTSRIRRDGALRTFWRPEGTNVNLDTRAQAIDWLLSAHRANTPKG